MGQIPGSGFSWPDARDKSPHFLQIFGDGFWIEGDTSIKISKYNNQYKIQYSVHPYIIKKCRNLICDISHHSRDSSKKSCDHAGKQKNGKRKNDRDYPCRIYI